MQIPALIPVLTAKGESRHHSCLLYYSYYWASERTQLDRSHSSLGHLVLAVGKSKKKKKENHTVCSVQFQTLNFWSCHRLTFCWDHHYNILKWEMAWPVLKTGSQLTESSPPALCSVWPRCPHILPLIQMSFSPSYFALTFFFFFFANCSINHQGDCCWWISISGLEEGPGRICALVAFWRLSSWHVTECVVFRIY